MGVKTNKPNLSIIIPVNKSDMIRAPIPPAPPAPVATEASAPASVTHSFNIKKGAPKTVKAKAPVVKAQQKIPTKAPTTKKKATTPPKVENSASVPWFIRSLATFSDAIVPTSAPINPLIPPLKNTKKPRK